MTAKPRLPQWISRFFAYGEDLSFIRTTLDLTADIEGLLMFDTSDETQDWIELQEQIEELVGEPPCVNFPDAFFSEDKHYVWERQAKALCNSCPVRMLCLDFAVKHPQHGIWGGTTPTERKNLRAKVLARQASSVRNAQATHAPTTKQQHATPPAVQPSESEQRS